MKIMDFWAPWCGPCKMMEPILDQMQEDFPDVELVKVNVDEVPDLARQHEVYGVPTYIVFDDDNNELKRFVGAAPKNDFYSNLGLT